MCPTAPGAPGSGELWWGSGGRPSLRGVRGAPVVGESRGSLPSQPGSAGLWEPPEEEMSEGSRSPGCPTLGKDARPQRTPRKRRQRDPKA